MTGWEIIAGGLFLANLAQYFATVIERRAWAKERRELCNRIQANTIDSYASLRRELEVKPVPQQVYTQADAVSESYVMPSVDIAASQDATRVLME